MGLNIKRIINERLRECIQITNSIIGMEIMNNGFLTEHGETGKEILNKLPNAVKLVQRVIIVQEFNYTNRFAKCLTGTRGGGKIRT